LLRIFFTLFVICVLAASVSKASDSKSIILAEEKIRFTNTIISLENQIKTLNESNALWKKSFLERAHNNSQDIEKLSKIDQNIRSNQYYDSIRDDYVYVIKLWRSFIANSF
jgi:hypothetical protein